MEGHARRHGIVRKHNETEVLRALYHRGPLTRSALSRETGLSKPTVNAIVERLVGEAWLRPTDDGAKPPAFGFGVAAGAGLGVSIDPSRVRVGIADIGGTRFLGEPRATPRSTARLLDLIGALTEEACENTGVGRDQLRLAVVSVPGVPHPGGIRLAANTPALASADLEDLLGRALGCEVVLANDVNLAAVAEGWQGPAAGSENYTVLHFGKGIGMGVVIGGRPVHGVHGAAGEIGYLPLGADPLDPRHARRGALESQQVFADVDALLRRDPDVALPAELLEPLATLIASAILAVQSVLDVELHVLTGPVGSREDVLTRVRELIEPVPLELAVTASELGESGPVVGALATAHRSLVDRLIGA
ncbi:ROK family transcriptional regulator [Jiangella anatolica]|uniref:HTH marR-type domain-containing protein n=1 Tax=Jiangella anatolica TaxID=2670374 RepID=A0A2W2C850_9ACTN|nr:ROK family transcriptional regulator [Jiangella anatolica]PZF81926.1 hypothetical protein C1I92_19060 [Jiangella anatolica]